MRPLKMMLDGTSMLLLSPLVILGYLYGAVYSNFIGGMKTWNADWA